MEPKIKAIIFDFDGTLADTVRLLLELFLKLGERFGKNVTEEDFYSRIGMGVSESMREMIREGKFRWTIIPYSLFNSRRLARKVHEEAKLYAYVHETLQALQQDYKLALVTSNKRKNIDYMCKKYDLFQYFEHIITKEDVKNEKPHPEPYLKMAEHLNIPPKNCLVIEDTPIGAAAARAAEMAVLVVLHTTPKHYFVEGSYPDEFINDLSSLTKDFINKRYTTSS